MMEKYIEKECKHHGITIFHLENRGTYRCKKCRSERVSLHRRRLKLKAVELLGGKCSICGYNKCKWALEFHHRENKEHTVSHLIRDRKETLLLQEIKKCDLVCSNCHHEIEEAKWGFDRAVM